MGKYRIVPSRPSGYNTPQQLSLFRQRSSDLPLKGRKRQCASEPGAANIKHWAELYAGSLGGFVVILNELQVLVC